MLPRLADFDALRQRWLARRDELEGLHALVDGATLCDTLLRELDAALRAERSAVLSLGEAARQSGYSADHLGRLIRSGVLANAGRPHAPKIRREDLPRKRDAPGDLTRAHAGVRSRMQIARSVVTSIKEHDDD